MLFLDNFELTKYITMPNITLKTTVAIYTAVKPPIPVFSPKLYIIYVPVSYAQCGYVYG